MFLFLFPRTLKGKLRDCEPLARLLDYAVVFLVLCAALAISYRLAEGASWADSLWLAWQTVSTVGYGDMPPKSALGRLGTGLFGLAAIIFLAPFIGAAFDYRQDCRDRKRRGMTSNPFQQGYVIFNFPGLDSCLSFLRQLRLVEPEAPVCIVDSALDELPPAVATLPRVHFLRGSLLERETYERASLRQNRAVIVYPNDRTRPDADGTTRVIVHMLQGFVGAETRIVHVLLDPDHQWLFDETRSVGIYADMESLALVQELHGAYTARAIEDLLMNSHGADPHTVPLRRLIGWTWRDLRVFGLQAQDRLGVTLNWLGLVHDGVPEMCPANDLVIREGDFLLVVTAHGAALDWERFEEEVARCKGGKG